MNKRIKQIVKQATEDVMKNTPSFLVTNEMWQEKFAELIVRECAVVAHNTAEGETTYGWVVGNKIKQHFGVEE